METKDISNPTILFKNPMGHTIYRDYEEKSAKTLTLKKIPLNICISCPILAFSLLLNQTIIRVFYNPLCCMYIAIKILYFSYLSISSILHFI